MFARVITAALALGLAGCTPVTPVATTAARPMLTEACAGRDGWSDPAPPATIFANVHYVGTCGIAVLLVSGPDGHILIDGATDEAVPSILANIRSLGFDPRDVKTIIGSHEHIDHMGGFASLKAATGAKLLLSAQARAVMARGSVDAADPQAGLLPDMKPVAAEGTIADGDVVRVGALALTAVGTPGHTSGGTSWTWRACEGSRCASIAYVDSLTAVSADGYRFIAFPERVAPFRASFGRIAALDCDILITPHPSVSNLFERVDSKAPLIDASACRRLVDAMRKRLDERLAKEASRER